MRAPVSYVSAPMTGPAGAEGRDVADGARLALADAESEAGGIAVTAEYLDVAGRNGSRSDPVTAGHNARTATEDSTAIAYIGELDSATSRTSVPITNSADVLQVAPGSGATDLVVTETFDDSVPEDVQATGERTFARVLPSDEVVRESFGSEDVISGPAEPQDLPDAGQEMLTRFEDEYGREPGPWVAYGYEAMASALGAIDRADDPLSRSSVVEAYFDGTERDSVLGTYSITEEGETTLDAPLAAYRVEDGEVLPAR
jgi:ABC-type branched-subunit amino acid transport system substrate-binding protein